MIHTIATVGILVIDNDKILLVKHLAKSDHSEGVYGLPGGKIQLGESIIDAAIRELYEETGLTTQPGSLQLLSNIYTRPILQNNVATHMTMQIVQTLTTPQGQICSNEETDPVWTNIGDLGSYNLLPNVQNIIEQYTPTN